MTKKTNYSAKNIEVLEGLEPVRKRPGMYIGSTNEQGLHHLVNEVLDNSIDEVVAGHADEVFFHYKKDGSILETITGIYTCKYLDNNWKIKGITGLRKKD